VAGIFTQIRPVWLGELETMPKTSKNEWLGPHIFIFVAEIFFSYVGYSVLTNFFV
jgi:hypothetical protein